MDRIAVTPLQPRFFLQSPLEGCPMTTTTTLSGGRAALVVTLQPPPRIVVGTRHVLRRAVDTLVDHLEEQGWEQVMIQLDLQHVVALDSSGIGMLLTCRRTIEHPRHRAWNLPGRRTWRLLLVSVPPVVNEVLHQAHLLEQFPRGNP